jgi:putative ABC transport system substrate-binding protein
VWYEEFVRALARRGWNDGANIAFEYRSVHGNPPQYDASAAELVGLNVDVIVTDSAPATRAAFGATDAIPIVGLDFTNDPVAAGYVQSYGQPGGNLTGFFLDAPGFSIKWVELLREMIPGLSQVAVLFDPAPGKAHLEGVQVATKHFGIAMRVVNVHRPADLEPAFSTLQGWPQALIILPSPMLWEQSERLAELTMKYNLPATSMAPPFAQAGGLLSYGPNVAEAGERCAILVAKILRGAKPGRLPVERPQRFDLIVNVKTANALALTVPETVLVSASRVLR